MELYAGLDVSLKETSICVVDGKVSTPVGNWPTWPIEN